MTTEAKQLRQAWWLSVAMVVLGALGVLAALAGLADAQEVAPALGIRGQVVSWSLDILGPIAAAGLAWLIAQAGLWLRTKTKNARLQQLIDNAAAAAAAGVRIVESDLRPSIIGLANNKLVPADRQRLRNEAVARMRASLGPIALGQVKAAMRFGNDELQAWLEARVVDAHARGVVGKSNP